MKMDFVPAELVHRVWPQVSEFVGLGVDYAHDEYTLEQVRYFVSSGQWLLYVFMDDEGIQGAMTLNIFNRPNDRVVFVTAIGGKNVVTVDTVDRLREIADQHGATSIEAAGRASMARLMRMIGFTEKYHVVGIKL